MAAKGWAQAGAGWLPARCIEAWGGLREEDGGSLAEFAFSVTVLMLMIFAILEVCLAAYSFHVLSEAARDGARYAIVHSTPSCSSPCTATSVSGVKSYVAGASYPGVSITASEVTVTYTTPAGASCTPGSGGTCVAGDLVKVTVAEPFNIQFPLLPATHPLNLTSTSQMVIAQ